MSNDSLVAALEPMIPGLRRYMRSMVRDPDLADDLVQDCLERAILNWGARKTVENTRQWVFAIAHNLAVNKLKQDTRRGVHVALEDLQEAEPSVSAAQESRVQCGELMRALAILPEEQRSVLLLVSVEDMSYADVAQTLEIPIGTVMSRLSRGRERLARALAGELPSTRAAPSVPHLRRMK